MVYLKIMEGTGLQYHGIPKDNGGGLGYNTMVYLKIMEGNWATIPWYT